MKLHQAIAGEKLGGMGPGLSPETGAQTRPEGRHQRDSRGCRRGAERGEVDLTDPASTLVLLKANAVVGVTGFFSDDGKTLSSVGIQCALCHSTVDDAYAPGIGQRLDGWPNRDLDIGAIVALAPDLTAFTEMLQIAEAEVKKALDGMGARQIRCPTEPRRKGVPAGWQDSRNAQSARLRTGRGEQSYMDRSLGSGQLLERLCRQSRNARQGRFLRSAT